MRQGRRGLVGIRAIALANIRVACIASVSFLLYKTNTENVLEVIGKNRSVMPFDVLGCTRATMTMSASIFSLCESTGKSWKRCRNMDC